MWERQTCWRCAKLQNTVIYAAHQSQSLHFRHALFKLLSINARPSFCVTLCSGLGLFLTRDVSGGQVLLQVPCLCWYALFCQDRSVQVRVNCKEAESKLVVARSGVFWPWRPFTVPIQNMMRACIRVYAGSASSYPRDRRGQNPNVQSLLPHGRRKAGRNVRSV